MRVKLGVANLLANNSNLRDSDKKLLLAFWRMEGFYLTEEQQRKFMNCTPAESITRARRDLSYKYPPSNAVQEERKQKEQQFSRNYSPKAISWLGED